MTRPAWQPSTPAVDAASMEKALRTRRVVVIHFWVAWNGHDRAMDDVIRNVRPDYEGRVEFRSMDAEARGNWTIALQAGVADWPALVCYIDARQADTMFGPRTRNELRAWVDRQLASLSMK